MQSIMLRRALCRARQPNFIHNSAFRVFSEAKKPKTRKEDLYILKDIINCDKKGFYKILGATALASVFNLLFASAMKELRSLLPENNDNHPEKLDASSLFKKAKSFIHKEEPNTSEAPKTSEIALDLPQERTVESNNSISPSKHSSSQQVIRDRNTTTKDEEKEKVIWFLCKWSLIFALSGVVTYYRRYVLGDYVNRVAVFLRYRLYNVLLKKNYSYFINNNVNSGQFVQKLSNDITAITWNLSEYSASLVRGLFLSIGGVTLSILSNPELAMLSVTVMTSFAFATRGFSNKMRKAKAEEMEALTKMSVLAGERLGNMKFIKVNNSEELERHAFLLRLQEFYNKSREVTKYTAYNYGVMDGFGQLVLFAIVFYGFYLSPVAIAGPEMISFLIYGVFTAAGIRGVFNSITELEKTASIYRSIYEIIKDEQSPLIDINQKADEVLREAFARQKAIEAEKLSNAPEIVFENVNFGFVPEKALLQGFNMVIKPKEIVALVGPSGSGKTTVLNLITKLLDPQRGKIMIDGHDISIKNEIWVRSNVSYVTQEPVLFQGTIEENLKYGNEGFDLSSENLERVCELANAKEFINSFPLGYQTVIGEKGLTISGGQRQKIALARALIKDPKILILDESTSSLDYESERAIVKELKNICKDRTCIIVTHKIDNFKDLITRFINIKE